ncbi:hypothetical protein EK21DRAFT_108202 [Setomelanomma holmii]|uniref:Uncharacterized protein n=1 Tax=Setomelanomma holmii TaxID=210430 RepID=A0A9P4LQE7_9PLEO|nr:hypothetical protein EK21DRAFT_108202 [Setomelanomma holmii]
MTADNIDIIDLLTELSSSPPSEYFNSSRSPTPCPSKSTSSAESTEATSASDSAPEAPPKKKGRGRPRLNPNDPRWQELDQGEFKTKEEKNAYARLHCYKNIAGIKKVARKAKTAGIGKEKIVARLKEVAEKKKTAKAKREGKTQTQSAPPEEDPAIPCAMDFDSFPVPVGDSESEREVEDTFDPLAEEARYYDWKAWVPTRFEIGKLPWEISKGFGDGEWQGGPGWR